MLLKKLLFIIVASLALTGCTLLPTQQNNNLQTVPTSPDLLANTIAIQNFAFSPSSLKVVAGRKVTVINDDSAPHTLTSDDGKFDTGNIDPGNSGSFIAPSSGTYTYHCNIHRTMTGTLVVE